MCKLYVDLSTHDFQLDNYTDQQKIAIACFSEHTIAHHFLRKLSIIVHRMKTIREIYGNVMNTSSSPEYLISPASQATRCKSIHIQRERKEMVEEEKKTLLLNRKISQLQMDGKSKREKYAKMNIQKTLCVALNIYIPARYYLDDFFRNTFIYNSHFSFVKRRLLFSHTPLTILYTSIVWQHRNKATFKALATQQRRKGQQFKAINLVLFGRFS